MTYFSPTKRENLKIKLWLSTAGGPGGQLLLAGIMIFVLEVSPLDFFGGRGVSLSGAFLMANLLCASLNLLPRQTTAPGFPLTTDGYKLIKTPFMSDQEIQRLLLMQLLRKLSSVENDGSVKQHKTTAETCEAFLKESPENTHIRIRLASSLIKLLRLTEAQSHLRKALEAPDATSLEPLIFNNIAWSILLINEPNTLQEGLRLAENATRVVSNQDFENTKACLLIEACQPAEGLNMLKPMVNLQKPINRTSNAMAGFLYLAYACFQLGDRQTGYSYLRPVEDYVIAMDAEDKHLYDLVRPKIQQLAASLQPLI